MPDREVKVTGEFEFAAGLIDGADHRSNRNKSNFEEAVLIRLSKSRIEIRFFYLLALLVGYFNSYAERGNYFKEIVNKFR